MRKHTWAQIQAKSEDIDKLLWEKAVQGEMDQDCLVVNFGIRGRQNSRELLSVLEALAEQVESP